MVDVQCDEHETALATIDMPWRQKQKNRQSSEFSSDNVIEKSNLLVEDTRIPVKDSEG